MQKRLNYCRKWPDLKLVHCFEFVADEKPGSLESQKIRKLQKIRKAEMAVVMKLGRNDPEPVRLRIGRLMGTNGLIHRTETEVDV